MKTILITALFALCLAKERKTLIVEVKYLNDTTDTLTLKSVQSPICIADYQNGEACLMVGNDSVICCDVMDYTILEIKP